MKKFSKNLITTTLAIFLVLGMAGSIPVLAATTPVLGLATTYAVLSSTYTNTTLGTTVSGDVGFTTGPALAPAGVHPNYGPSAPYAAAGTNQGTALSSLNSQSCTFTFAAGAINLSTDITHGSVGIYAPGVYCSSGAMNIGGPLTLNGSGTYIFRSSGALTSTVGSSVTLNGGSTCDVFWTPTEATTLAANTSFAGTIIDDAGITIGANTTWVGRALAFGGTVTTDTDTISTPTCAIATPSTPTPTPVPTPTPTPAPTPTPLLATLHVIKKVVNTNGGTATSSLFQLHVKLSGTDVTGSPAAGTVAPGTSYSLVAGTYVVSEDANTLYVKSFSGDCDSSGAIILAAGTDKTCTVTNTDIAVVVIKPVVKPVVLKTPVTPVVTSTPAVTKTVTTPLTTPIPGLPSAGLPPTEKKNPWDVVLSACAVAIGLFVYAIRRKQV